MATRTKSNTSRGRLSSMDNRPAQQTLRPTQVSVPDIAAPTFAKEARRQSRAVARSSHAAGDQKYIDSISEE